MAQIHDPYSNDQERAESEALVLRAASNYESIDLSNRSRGERDWFRLYGLIRLAQEHASTHGIPIEGTDFVRSVSRVIQGAGFGKLRIEGEEPSLSEADLEREHQELAVLVAYTEDEHLRSKGDLHGSAQTVATAIQDAGYRRDGWDLSDYEELRASRDALQEELVALTETMARAVELASKVDPVELTILRRQAVELQKSRDLIYNSRQEERAALKITQKERDSRIALDSEGRQGLSTEDLDSTLEKILGRYTAGDEQKQRRAIKAARMVLAESDDAKGTQFENSTHPELLTTLARDKIIFGPDYIEVELGDRQREAWNELREGAYDTGLVELKDLANRVFNVQIFSLSNYFDGLEGKPVLTDGLQVVNLGEPHEYLIHRDDAMIFFGRVKAYEAKH